jgi:hypothetical protein
MGDFGQKSYLFRNDWISAEQIPTPKRQIVPQQIIYCESSQWFLVEFTSWNGVIT